MGGSIKVAKINSNAFIVNDDIVNGIKYHINRKDNSKFDMCIIDPPYYRKVDQEWDKQWFTKNDYLAWCKSWIEEIAGVVKKSATVWLFGYPEELSYLLGYMREFGFQFKQQIVIDKGLQSIAGRSSKNLKMFPTATEYLYMFYNDSRDYIRDELQKERKRLGWTGADVNKYLGKATSGGGTFSTIASEKKPREYRIYPTKDDWVKLQEVMQLPDYEDLVYTFKVPKGVTDVWNDINFYNRSEKKIHPTQKPTDLIQRIIDTAEYPQRILDPFSGSGSTYQAIKQSEFGNDHMFLGIEKDEEMFQKSIEYVSKR